MTTTTTITTITTITITSDILAQIFCGIAGMADNDFAARKSEGAGAVEDERWRRWMQNMKKNIISKNIVCETCNAVCQHVCYHKTNFSATDINPDCRLIHFCCPVACASSTFAARLRRLILMDREDEEAETQKCECLRTSRDPRLWCERCKREARDFMEQMEELFRALAQNKKRRLSKDTSRKKEETRGEAEDRIAMQLATDQSVAAEMEEEG